MLLASAAPRTPCCNATEITTLPTSRIAASPELSFAPLKKSSAGRPVSSKPIVADKVMLPTTMS
jgi:hypothetical protein